MQTLEYAIATYNGLYFIHVSRNIVTKKTQIDPSGKPKFVPPPYEVNLLKEVYFKDKNVSRFLEYAPGLFAVCLFKDDQIYLLNREEQTIEKIKKPGGKSCCFELCSVPVFHLQSMPFIFCRDDKSLYIICLKEGFEKITTLI